MYSKSRCHSAALAAISLLGFVLSIASAQAQVKTRLSIATGGTRGGTYRMAFDEDNLVGAGLVGRCRAGFGLSGSDRGLGRSGSFRIYGLAAISALAGEHRPGTGSALRFRPNIGFTTSGRESIPA
jgi:hypothetical protein